MAINKLNSDRISESIIESKNLNKAASTKAAEKVKDVAFTAITGTQNADSSEKVQWSADAQLASEALQIAQNTNDVRAEKVKALKDSIRSGAYQIDAQKIADRMLESSIEEGVLSAKL